MQCRNSIKITSLWMALVQNFAARVLIGTKKFYNISPVLYKLGCLFIENQLLARDATQMYKIVNNLAPTCLCNNIHERSDVHLYNTRRKNYINPPLCRTTTAQRSFFYRCTRTWNSSTRDTRNSLSLSSFKLKVYAELRRMTLLSICIHVYRYITFIICFFYSLVRTIL